MTVELPKDAEGREIPLDTETLYDKDGQEIEVSRYQYYPKVGTGYWTIRSEKNKFYRQDEVYLTPPDSWEKLEEDLGRICSDGGEPWFCNYANEGTTTRNICQENCKFFYPDDQLSCRNQAVNDIVSRICKLRGEDE